MFKQTKLVISLFFIFSSGLSAHQRTYEKTDESFETKICVVAAKNNLSKYKRIVKRYSSRKIVVSLHRTLARKLKCNDQTLHEFAVSQNAKKTAKYISRFL